METEETVIIGASAAGLATCACLSRRKKAARVLEAAPHVGASWRGHYDRLHLHTSRGLSGLPGLPLPKSYPKYPSRDQVVEEQPGITITRADVVRLLLTRALDEVEGHAVPEKSGLRRRR